MKHLAKGSKVGNWEVGSRIGKGGNGDVYMVTFGSQTGALKRLRPDRIGPMASKRFETEILAMRACQTIPGVLRLLDFDVSQSGGFSWFVTELAEPFSRKLAGASFDDVLIAVASIAGTLADMHDLGYAHRDIKPDNLFWAERVGWAVGDFGLVTFPEKTQLTKEGTKLGPLHYMAPEMLTDAASADGKAADVYSLAKVLWATAAGEVFPMPGHLHRDIEQLRLSNWVSGIRPQRLDGILHAATHPDPAARPTMRDFQRELDAAGQPTRAEVATSVSLPSWMTKELSERSGERERLEQASANQRLAAVQQRIRVWLSERFDGVMDDLQNALSSIEGLQNHRLAAQVASDVGLATPGGLPDQKPEHAYFESSIFGSIKRASGPYLDFAFGVRVEVSAQLLRYSGGAMHVPLDTLPINVVAGYIGGHLSRHAHPIWTGDASFIIGGAQDLSECQRLAEGLKVNFVGAFEALLREANTT
jgi:serine/threonine protein kinase